MSLFIIIKDANQNTSYLTHLVSTLKTAFDTENVVCIDYEPDNSSMVTALQSSINRSCKHIYLATLPWSRDFEVIDEDVRKMVSDIMIHMKGIQCSIVNSGELLNACVHTIEKAFYHKTLTYTKYQNTAAQEIQKQSFFYIESRINRFTKHSIERSVLVRIIHSTADFSLEPDLLFSKNAAPIGVDVLRKGSPVITDVKMVKAGVARLFRDRIIDALSHPEADALARKTGLTCCAAGMECLKEKLGGSVVVIGNAPTALMHCLRIAETGGPRPALIIGCPVGFVGAAESKAELMRSNIPYITIQGNRGGSSIAAAALNAIGERL